MSGQELAACPDGWFGIGFRPGPCLAVGVLVGIVLAVVSAGFGLLPTGHQFNDPIMIAIAPGTLLGGLLYFNFKAFISALSFPILAGGLAWMVLRLAANHRNLFITSQDSARAARIALVVSVLPVWLQEVAGLQVLLWYGIATWLAMVIAGQTARLLTRI